MQTASVPRPRSSSSHPQTSLLPAAAPKVKPHVSGSAASRHGNLDTLLRQAPDAAPVGSLAGDTAPSLEMPGLFLGLRAALLFNMALGVACFVAYELWTAIAR